MAVSAAGIPILLQAASVQLQDLVGALSPGDTLKGRVVELLPQNQALISLRGQNVVAQLPAGTALTKGEILSLQVSQASPGDDATAASLVLKLIPSSTSAATLAGQAGGPSLSSTSASATPGFSQLEQALGAAKLPVNGVNLALAQTLSRLGAPLDAQTLQTLSRSVESLISNEQAPTTQAGSALADPAVQQALQEGLAQLKVAAQMSPSSQQAVALMQAARGLEGSLEAGTNPTGLLAGSAAAAEGKSWPAVIEQAIQQVLADPSQAQVRNLEAVLNQVAQSAESSEGPGSAADPASPLSGAPGPAGAPVSTLSGAPGSAAGPASALSAAPGPAGAPASTISGAPGSAGAPASPLSAASGSLAGPASTVSGAAGSASTLAGAPASAEVSSLSGASALNAALPSNSADIPAMREALAQWLGPMNQQPQSLSAASLAQSAQSLAGVFSDPSRAGTQRLIAAVQAQSPQSSPQAIQSAAVRALQQAADFYSQLPGDRSLPGVQAVQSDLRAQGLPVPRADLATLPPETVADAVAWLSARGLPPQRPLVETVAGWMAQDRSTLPAAQKALQAQAGLPEEDLAARPSLKQAYEALGQALDSAGIDPEADGLSGRLQAWASAQGLTLESDLADPSGAPFSAAPRGAGELSAAVGGGEAAARPDAAGAGASLRGALLHLENELSEALQSTQAQSSPAGADGINSALRDAQAAVRGFNALPLQAQGAPSFDTVHLPMPVWMNGVMGDGRLSVTWRQGRERGLDDKEPVSVAVSLNTESLGPVTVTLQVWKNAAGARVIAQDKPTAAFLAQGADDLRSGFSENTPFALRSLDFSAADASPVPEFPPPQPSGAGLSLSA